MKVLSIGNSFSQDAHRWLHALAVKEGIVPPTIHYKEPDPACDLDVCPNVAREVELDLALSVSLGFGGHNACIALRKCTD